ncbi:MAG: flagellar export protein FliJ [Burkholderiales bacterium]|nr:flagellar export protein FliJ [Burkholderiales bacterium]
MSTIQSLLSLLDSAQKARDEALAQLEGSRRIHEAARKQAQSLADWRKDYQQRWSSKFSLTGGMEIMRCYQDFTARLGDAVSEQDKRVEQAKQTFDQCRAHLIERERKVAAVEQLIERRQQEHSRKLERQDQKATDEQAARSGRGSSPFAAFGATHFVPTSY